MFRACTSTLRFATLAVVLIALAAVANPAFAGGGSHGGGGGGGNHGGGAYYHGGDNHGGYDHYHGFYGVSIGVGVYPGWGYGYGNAYGYGLGYPWYYPGGVIVADPGYYGTPAPQPPYIGPQPTPLPPPTPAPQPNPSPTSAAVEVRVPVGAQVWFDDTPTRQSGDVRLFETPPLDGGKIAHYTVRAKWTDGGKDYDQTRQVNVQAGRRTVVDFLRAEVELLPSPKE